MGKTGKWIRNFLTGKKDKEREKDKKSINQPHSVITDHPPTTPISTHPPTTPKEKRRWSFRRSSATNCQKEFGCTDTAIPTTPPPAGASGQLAVVELESEQKKHAMAMAAATAAATDAAVAAAQAAATVIRLTSAAGRAGFFEEAAAVKIQSVFRAYLARKALCALRGLVKLQALVRGHLVRKQATATLRCMQALVTVQARARAQRIRMSDEFQPNNNNNSLKQVNHRKSTPDNRFRLPYNEMDRGMEENIKIVEMDLGESKGSTKGRNSYSNSQYSHPQPDRSEHRFSTHSAPNRPYSSHNHRDVSPSPSAAMTETSPRALSGHFEDYSFGTAQSSPQYYSSLSKPHEYVESLYTDNPFFPSYMANTQSSRAKARSQSAPKSRPEGYERQPSRRKMSLEGRNVPRAVKMQRSSSHVGSAGQNNQYSWSMLKLDRSSVSLKDSECGSTSTVQTNNIYCRSLVGFDVNGNRY